MSLSVAQLSQVRVLIAGDIMLDRYWFGDTHRISPEAPVPVVQIRKTDERLGGAANVARNAATLCQHTQASIAMLGVIGADEPGQTIGRLLQECGAQAYLHADPRLPTTIKLRVLAQQQQLLRVDFENAPSADSLRTMLDQYTSLLPNYDIVLLSDYGKGGLSRVKHMITAARTAGKTILVDPKGSDYSKYQGATVITPNRSELRQVVGDWRTEADLSVRAQNLRRELRLEALLLTRSEEGMTLYTETEVLHVQAQAREVFDVSGAGDTVIATLAVMLGSGMPLKEAVQYANRAAGVVVTKLGTSTLSLDELLQAHH